MRKVCVVTTSRSDYDLLKGLLSGIRDSDSLVLQLVVSGMHLSPEFGSTWRAIEDDGFEISRRVEMLLSSDTGVGVAKAIGVGIIGFADVLDELEPEILVLLGDRFELLAVACAALVMRVPIAHIHGGETTEGAFDEAVRHSITKMSHLHFVAAEPYRARVIQMGEDPDCVFTVGGLGVDAISRTMLLTRPQIEERLGIKFHSRNLLITFHPITLDATSSVSQFAELLAALGEMDETTLLFTMPNADTEGRQLASMVADFTNRHRGAHAFESLGDPLYLSCMNEVDAVVGNSSSGLLEAPALGTATVNIGSRQQGRLMAPSVVSCAPDRQAIKAAIARVCSPRFKDSLSSVCNPFGTGGATESIISALEDASLAGIIMKRFHDLKPLGETAAEQL